MKIIRCLFVLILFSLTFNSYANKTEISTTATQAVVAEKELEKQLTDDEKLHQLILDIEALELDIKVRFDDLNKLEGERRALLGVQILDLNREITNGIDSAVVLLQDIKKSGATIDDYVKSMHGILNKRNKQLLKIHQFMLKGMDEFYKESVDIADANRFTFEQKVNKARQIVSDLFLAFQKVIDVKNQLEIDSGHDVRVFSDLLEPSSGRLSSMLKLVSSEIKNKKNEISGSGDAAKKKLNIELSALNEKRKGVIDALSLLITLMQKNQLETAKLSQLLITSSGTINQQIFDKEVITGLFLQWTNELEKWLMLNASAFVATSIIVIFILLLFRVLSNMIGKLINRAIKSANIQISILLREFFVVSVQRFIMFIGVLIALSQMGVELGPLLAGLGVLGFVVGFALQGVLSNFASGLMILIYRPYDVGDVVEIAKVKGTVLEMSMVSTTMLSFNNEKLVIPNNSIWGSLIRNITSEATRRIDMVFKISFDADIDQLDKIFAEEVNAIPAVLAEPAPTIELNKQHETHLEFIVRPWVKTSDYWSTYWRLNKSIQKRMQAEGVPKLNPYEFLKPLINKV